MGATGELNASTFNRFVSLQSLKKSRLPQKLRMVVLSNRPNFEFRAFQVSACYQ